MKSGVIEIVFKLLVNIASMFFILRIVEDVRRDECIFEEIFRDSLIAHK